MTRIKRCISVIVLAVFTVMLLVGCKSPSVDDVTTTWKTDYELKNLSVLQLEQKKGVLSWEAYVYARYKAGFDDTEGVDFENFKQINADDVNTLTTGNYRIASDNGITTLKALNNWVAGGSGDVSFIVYKATKSNGDTTYIIGVSVTVYSTSDESSSNDADDEPTSSGCTSGCECNMDCTNCGNCSCDSDTYNNCICGS